jgi:rod shape determining protein RodA
VLQKHQTTRIKVFLGMENNLSGEGYNVNQSKIAIGSGGFWGKGFLNGTQTKLKYVPEQHTDFIFCTVGEEWGFVGSFSVLIIYWFFLMRMIKLAERQRNSFNRIFGYGVVSIFFFHLVINIGMVIGLMPVIGIPLPFFSYGGSSLLGFTLLLLFAGSSGMSRCNGTTSSSAHPHSDAHRVTSAKASAKILFIPLNFFIDT